MKEKYMETEEWKQLCEFIREKYGEEAEKNSKRQTRTFKRRYNEL